MSSREEEDEILEQWSKRLVEALNIPGLEVDVKSVLGLAGKAAHSLLRPAAPLTTYIVGYAAGVAAASGHLTGAEASEAATKMALQLCRDEASNDKTSKNEMSSEEASAQDQPRDKP